MRKVWLLVMMFVSIARAMEDAESSGGAQPKTVPRPTKEPPKGGEGPDVTPEASATGTTASTGSHPLNPATPPTDVIIGQVAKNTRNLRLNGIKGIQDAHQAASAYEPETLSYIRTRTEIDTETHAPTIMSKEPSLDNTGR